MSDATNCNDPWQTPSTQVDPELRETSQRLMAKSEVPPPHAESEATALELEEAQQKIVELKLQQKRIFQRNVSLTAEIAQLRAQNQHLGKELAQCQTQLPPPKTGWLRGLFSR